METQKSPTEELREALLDLEDARNREARQRQTAETLLAGLRALVLARGSGDLFSRLFQVLRGALDYASAFVLIAAPDGTLTPQASSDARFASTVWRPGPMLRRVIAGQPVAVFDTRQTEEWQQQSAELREAARAALHFAVHTAEQQAVFVGVHPDRGHFSRDHLDLARRFSMLATQALQTLESETRLADLEEKLATEAKLAALNQRLVESEKRLSRAKKMEALGLLAGGVAHDLNNILSGIGSYPELILMDEELAPRHRKALGLVHGRDWAPFAFFACFVVSLLSILPASAVPRERSRGILHVGQQPGNGAGFFLPDARHLAERAFVRAQGVPQGAEVFQHALRGFRSHARKSLQQPLPVACQTAWSSIQGGPRGVRGFSALPGDGQQGANRVLGVPCEKHRDVPHDRDGDPHAVKGGLHRAIQFRAFQDYYRTVRPGAQPGHLVQ
jgi:signal transduction histidine kinase